MAERGNGGYKGLQQKLRSQMRHDVEVTRAEQQPWGTPNACESGLRATKHNSSYKKDSTHVPSFLCTTADCHMRTRHAGVRFDVIINLVAV